MKFFRISFGLPNTPVTYQQLIESCLDELHIHWSITYLDNIITFFQNPDDHITWLECVFEKVTQKQRLNLNHQSVNSSKYLDYIVTKDGDKSKKT